MPQSKNRALKITAEITDTYVSMTLQRIVKIKPFNVSIHTFKPNGETRGVGFSVINGAGRGADICLYAYSKTASCEVRNGALSGERTTKIIYKNLCSISKESCAELVYAYRSALELYFKHTLIDFEFVIKDSRIPTDIRPAISIRYLNPSYVEFKLIEPDYKGTYYLLLKDNIKEYFNPKDIFYASTDTVIVKLSQFNQNNVYSCLTKIRRNFSVWLLPCVDEDTGKLFTINTDITFKVEKMPPDEGHSGESAFRLIPQVLHYGIPTKDYCHRTERYWTSGNMEIFNLNDTNLENKYYVDPKYYLNLHSPLNRRTKQTKYTYDGTSKYRSLPFATVLDMCYSAIDVYTKVNTAVGRGTLNFKFSVDFCILGQKFTVDELQEIRTNVSNSHVDFFKFESDSVNKTQIKGVISIPEKAEEIHNKAEIVEYFGDAPRRYSLNLKGDTNELTETGLSLNVVPGEPCIFDLSVDTEDFDRLNRALNCLFEEVQAQYKGFLVIKTEYVLSLELPPTKRCTPFDYNIAIGAEFETGIPEVYVDKAVDERGEGVIYGHAHDGGGLELKSVICNSPTVFSWIGKFDSLCKNIRHSPAWGPCQTSSTHFHISINPGDKKTVPVGKTAKEVNPTYYGSAMFRRTLIGHNWWSLFMEYTQALAFFDTFNPGTRRQCGYGKAFGRNKTASGKYTLVYNDIRFGSYWGKKYEDISQNVGRSSLLRTNTDDSDNTQQIHWEWRGTDACPSALFTGLKVELLQAIARKAIHLALRGEQRQLFDETIKDELNAMVSVESVFDITDVICRKKAKKAIEELKPYMSKEAYKGLKAWVTYVKIVGEDVGTLKWFEEMESILIQKMGVNNFLTSKELQREFSPTGDRGGTFIPKMSKTKAKYINKKKEMYLEVIPKESLKTKITQSSLRTEPRGIPTPEYCTSCGRTYVPFTRIKGLGMCGICSKEDPKAGLDVEHGEKKFTPRKAMSAKLKKIIYRLVSEPLSSNKRKRNAKA